MMFALKVLSLVVTLCSLMCLALGASTPDSPKSPSTKEPLVLSRKGQKIEKYIDFDLYGPFYHVKSGCEMRVGHLTRAGEKAIRKGQNKDPEHPDSIKSRTKVKNVLNDIDYHIRNGNLRHEDKTAIHEAMNKARQTHVQNNSQDSGRASPKSSGSTSPKSSLAKLSIH